MLHIAAKDIFPPEAQKAGHGRAERQSAGDDPCLSGNGSCFAREGGQHYDKACADLANTRTDTSSGSIWGKP
jgi:hypothetical protein